MVCWLPGTEAGPELQVQADFDDVDGFLEAGIGGEDDRPASGRGTHEGGRIVVVELVVVPLHEAGEPVREGVLAADTGGPAAAAGVIGRVRNTDPVHPQLVVSANPGAAALGVEHEAVPGIADAAGDGCERLR